MFTYSGRISNSVTKKYRAGPGWQRKWITEGHHSLTVIISNSSSTDTALWCLVNKMVANCVGKFTVINLSKELDNSWEMRNIKVPDSREINWGHKKDLGGLRVVLIYAFPIRNMTKVFCSKSQYKSSAIIWVHYLMYGLSHMKSRSNYQNQSRQTSKWLGWFNMRSTHGDFCALQHAMYGTY